MTGTAAGMRLDDLFPHWQHRERHRLAVDAPPDTVWRAVQEVTWREVPLFRMLMIVRGSGGALLPLDRPVIDTMTARGFYVLDRTGDELVVGAIARRSGGQSQPGRLFGNQFRDFDRPGHVKIGFNFSYRAGILSTETRVWAMGDRTRRGFRLYWLIIRLPSGLIRRAWLRAVRRRACRPAVVA